MVYQKFYPADVLSALVECYFLWESNGPLEKEMLIESPPNSFCSIVINYGSPYFLQNIKYTRLEVPMQFVSGLSIYSYKLCMSHNIGLAGIVLKPAALATLFNLPAFEFTEERRDLFDVLAYPHVFQYVDRIKQATGSTQRIKLLEEFLLHHCNLVKPQPDYIDHAANLIVQKNGMLHIADLLKDSCMSRRTFERRFFQKVGLSPKYYARIRRMSYLCNLIAGKRKVNWADVFYEAEFYDQAHFIKDFEEFTGRSPQQYLKENTELANIIDKPMTQQLK